MSSPTSSLKKGRRNPLNPRQPTVPYRNAAMDMTPEKMLSEIPSDFLRRDVLGRLPKASHKGPMTAPSDHELMGSMVSRLAQAENELRNAKKEIIDKDKKIKILQEKVQLLDKARGYSSGTIGDLERKCQALQAQVHEMEEFLADYGMVWVGNSSPTESAYMPLDDDAHPNEDSMVTPTGCGVWNPAASVANPSFEVNFDLVLKNVKELNVLAGEGCAVISRTKDGARLKVPDSIPLALYYNGIVMFEGPFRPFTDPTTQQCMRDIMEGYFPSELQSRYPDGVPINVTDRRETVYSDRRTEILFPGEGQSLDKKTSEGSLSAIRQVTSTAPGPKHSMEQFLSRLPQAVVKEGKIIDVRAGVEQTIKGSGSQNDVIVVETPALQDIKARADDKANSSERVSSAASRVTTLRIKSENGEQTYILKMNFTDTVADIHSYLDTVRPKNSPPYKIKSTFPNMVYSDPTVTLEECGLVPNATLHLLPGKA